MSDDRIREQVHLAVDETAKTAAPDPWLAQKIRAQAERKDEEPVRKKLPAGMMIILAVILMLTAAAAALTNGFGILDYNTEQAGNEAYIERIMKLGQQWDGEYCSIEINEAVFDGMTMAFTMQIIPKEGADPVYIVPKVKAMAGDRELKVYPYRGAGAYDEEGFWVPDIMPAIGVDYEETAAEYAIGENGWEFDVTNEEIEWTVSFDILHTDWPIRFTEVDESTDGYDPEPFAEAYRKHELLLDTYGGVGYLMAAVAPEDEMEGTDDWNGYVEEYLTREIFRIAEKAEFSFVTDSSSVKTAAEPYSIILPDGYKATMTRLTANEDQVYLTMKVEHTDSTDPVEQDEWHWDFMLLSEDAGTGIQECGGNQDGLSEIYYYDMHCTISKPVNSVIVVPVRREYDAETGSESRDMLYQVEEQQKPVTEEQAQMARTIQLK